MIHPRSCYKLLQTPQFVANSNQMLQQIVYLCGLISLRSFLSSEKKAAQLHVVETIPIGHFDLALDSKALRTSDVLISNTMKAEHSIEICGMYWYIN